MSLTNRKRHVMAIMPMTRLGWLKAHYMHAADRVGPVADNARDVAAHRIVDARTWAAPRLDRAAHSVEDQLAPKVSAFLSDVAKMVDPTPPRSRRWPFLVFIGGVAMGAAGYMLYRRNAEQWTETMKESAADASHWVGEKAGRAGEMFSDKADSADQQADDMSRKMS